jgi:hypothetical protein
LFCSICWRSDRRGSQKRRFWIRSMSVSKDIRNSCAFRRDIASAKAARRLRLRAVLCAAFRFPGSLVPRGSSASPACSKLKEVSILLLEKEHRHSPTLSLCLSFLCCPPPLASSSSLCCLCKGLIFYYSRNLIFQVFNLCLVPAHVIVLSPKGYTPK